MDIVKKNLLSIIFGVIALASLIAWIWPLGSIRDDAQKSLDERVGAYGKMESLLKQQRKMPQVSLKGGDDQPLEVYPTDKVIAWGKGIQEELAGETLKLKAAAVEINRRGILVPQSLPEPAPTRDFAFRDIYREYLRTYAKRWRVGTPPTNDDINLALQELWTTKYAPNIVIRDGKEQPESRLQADTEFNKERPEVPERVKVARAQSIQFYMNDPMQTLDVNTSIVSGDARAMGTTAAPPTATAIWDAQLKMWIQDDVVRAISELNQRESKLKCVIDAPVKYLLKIQTDPVRGAKPISSAAAAMPMGGMPVDAMPEGMMPPDMGGLSPDMTAPNAAGAGNLTGRTSGALYDVVPFKLVVHVEADKLPLLLQELGRNRLMTATHVNMQAVDSILLGASQNVMYGSAPVVQATISCEALLLREWTVPLMPRAVRMAYGVPDAAPQP